jgi:hypothetical protein
MNWITLKALNEIYLTEKTPKKETVLKDSYIKYMLRDTKELRETSKEILGSNDFKELYRQTHLSNFEKYKSFLVRNALEKPQTRFEESDINILMDIEERMLSGELLEIRDQMIKAEETVRGVSLMFFKNEKYLEGKESLIKAVKQLLNIQELASDKDQQYKYVLECKNPKCIVLCENIDFLKRPSAPRKNNIELWYAGGKNISKLDFSSTRHLPIFYSCDWDYDGLLIFEAVKEKIKDIIILYPTGQPKGIIATEHKSLWPGKSLSDLSSLNVGLFNTKEQTLIKSLLENDQWIIEESNNLIEMIIHKI